MHAEDEVPILKTSNKVLVLLVVGEQQHSWMLTPPLIFQELTSILKELRRVQNQLEGWSA